MHQVFLLLGSNLGNRKLNINSAIDAIANKLGEVVSISSIYETAAWGNEDQPSFLNQVARIETQLTPHQLLKEITLMEKVLGRVRHKHWGERLIDIDILYYDSLEVNTPDLKIPHPQIQNRRFTLVPLVEVAGDFIHPILNKSQQQLLTECADPLDVGKWNMPTLT